MTRLQDIFAFSEEYPLIFTQINFWIFFAIVYLIFALVYKKRHLRSAYLFLVSLLFYYKTSGLFIGIFLFSTLTDFFIGKAIYNSRHQLKRKILVVVSVAVNLGTLSYFKYAYFFTDAYNYFFQSDVEVFNILAYWANSFSDAAYFSVDAIILPVGISFYTFQTISYSVDIYRNKLKPLNSIIDFGFFVSFFPQLVAGPIVRAADFVPQISKTIQISRTDFGKGTFLILKGLIKKMIFADFIAMNFLDAVFDMPQMYSGFANIMAMVGYSLQIYGDFSGYTDIAIGLALLMGYQLPKNFDSPYKALNCGEYWKRWHISLSSWLKDYLYIPLGGNRQGSAATYLISAIFLAGVLFAIHDILVTAVVIGVLALAIAGAKYSPAFKNHINTNINVMLTMLIGGLWHGASWKFVIWGGLNGLGILAYKYWRRISPYEQSTHAMAMFWKIALTFAFITFTRIYFRGNSMSHISQFYRQVATNMDWANAFTVLWGYKLVFLVMLAGYITHWAPSALKNKLEQQFIASPMPIKGAVAVVVAVLCYQTYAADFQPFIYFQF